MSFGLDIISTYHIFEASYFVITSSPGLFDTVAIVLDTELSLLSLF